MTGKVTVIGRDVRGALTETMCNEDGSILEVGVVWWEKGSVKRRICGVVPRFKVI